MVRQSALIVAVRAEVNCAQPDDRSAAEQPLPLLSRNEKSPVCVMSRVAPVVLTPVAPVIGSMAEPPTFANSDSVVFVVDELSAVATARLTTSEEEIVGPVVVRIHPVWVWFSEREFETDRGLEVSKANCEAATWALIGAAGLPSDVQRRTSI